MKSIIAFRTDRFGETMLIIPALQYLKRRHPDAALVLVVAPEVAPFARTWQVADTVLEFSSGSHRFRELFDFASGLRIFDASLAVIFNPSKELHLISFLAGIKKRAGYSRKWPFFLTTRIPDLKHLAEKHEMIYNLELAAAATGGTLTSRDTAPETLTIPVNNAIIPGLREKFGIPASADLCAIHPWTSDPLKQWPLERFQKLIEMISSQGTHVVIVGKDDPRKSELFFSSLGKKTVNLTGKTSLEELAGLLSGCRLLISGDSGPVHLASCVGTPSLVLFRNDLPGKTAIRWGPLAPGSMVLEKPSLMDINVDETFKAACRRVGSTQISGH